MILVYAESLRVRCERRNVPPLRGDHDSNAALLRESGRKHRNWRLPGPGIVQENGALSSNANAEHAIFLSSIQCALASPFPYTNSGQPMWPHCKPVH